MKWFIPKSHPQHKKLNRVIVACCLLVIIGLMLYVGRKNHPERIFTEYGWQVLGGRSQSTVVMSESFLAEEINQWMIIASKEMGLDPTEYQGKTIAIYSYPLGEIGLDRNIWGEVWLYKNRIICAFIKHAEPNKKLAYWPLDVEISVIREHLKNN